MKRRKQETRRITLPKINGLMGRAVAFDNLATEQSPALRKRIVTPLTPKAVAERSVKAAAKPWGDKTAQHAGGAGGRRFNPQRSL